METEMEDGVYLAVSCYVYVVFCLFFLGWLDALCVYAAYQRGGVEHGFECRLASQRLLLLGGFFADDCAGGGLLLGHRSSRGGHLHVCVVLDLSLCRSRSRLHRRAGHRRRDATGV